MCDWLQLITSFFKKAYKLCFCFISSSLSFSLFYKIYILTTSLLTINEALSNYCITQHLHLGFFLITTCSTWFASTGACGIMVPLCTSSAPGLVSFCTLPLVAFFGVACRSLLTFFGDSVIGSFACFVTSGVGDDVCSETLFSSSLASVWSSKYVGDALPPDVGVIGLPPFISSTISSASLLKSPPGRKGLSQPLSVLKTKTSLY